MIELIQARFIGLDGSVGYRHGQTYSLLAETNPNGPEIVIKMSDSGSGRCPYDNVLAFLKNWADVQISESSTTPSQFAASTDVDSGGAARYVDSKGNVRVIADIADTHLINIARKNWRTGRKHEGIDAEMTRRNLNIKEHLRKEDLE